MRKSYAAFVAVVIWCMVGLAGAAQRMPDYETFEKIDAHVHIGLKAPEYLEAAVENKFRLLTMNTDSPGTWEGIRGQRECAIYQMQKFPGRIQYATAFSVEGCNDPDWQDKAKAYLDESFEKGAIAVKVWKNIGMVAKDKNGNFIMIDDPRFEPIIQYLIEKKIPLAGHIGEPKNCWLPIEQMTVNNDKDYFKSHPQYHMYLHPEYPSYEALVASRDRLLVKHPELRFVGCHLGSLEWSVDELAKRLRQFPNMAVDMTERISHLQYQSLTDRKKVRNFMIEFQDQLIYGTDLGSGRATPENAKEHLTTVWKRDWRYFTTGDTMTVPRVNGEFQALDLPPEAVIKLYRTNAEKWYPGI